VVGTLTSKPAVELRNSAQVRGNVETGGSLTKLPGATVTGTVTQNQPVPLESTSFQITFPATNTGNVGVGPNVTVQGWG
jgi:hypothetical protein